MKILTIALTSIACITNASHVFSSPLEDRLNAMEKRLMSLEQKVVLQKKLIDEKEQQIKALSAPQSSKDAWFKNIEVSGLVEIEAQQVSSDGSDDVSDLYVATAELAVAAQIHDWAAAEVVLLYEDEGDHSGELDVDVATVTIADPDANWFLTTGQYTLPFGDFSSNMVSDPVTLDMAEMADAAVQAGYSLNGFTGSVYAFKGDQETEINNFGFNLGFESALNNGMFNIGVGWINDIAESDIVIDDGTTMSNKAAAWTLFAQVDFDNFTMLGEYVAAVDSLDAYSTKDKTSAYNVEAAYHFNGFKMPVTIALGYQGTDDAGAYAGGLDRKKWIATLSSEVMDGTHLSFEYMKAEDYDNHDTDTLTSQLAITF